MWIRLASIGLLACATTLVANASPVTFTLHNAIFASGATITGTTVIDTATGLFVSADVAYKLGSSTVVFNGPFGNTIFLPGGLYNVFYDINGADVADAPGNMNVADLLEFLIPVHSLVGYQGGPLCSYQQYYCGGGLFSGYYGRTNLIGIDPLGSGDLVLPAAVVTPEPPSGVLMATFAGVSGALLMFWRRALWN